MIEAKRGWANTVSTKQDYGGILDGLGSRYEALLNTYKPFACGIVMHPAIDAVIQLRNENRLTADQIERVDLKVHPLVLELTGKKTPQTGSRASSASITPSRSRWSRARRGEAVQRSGRERSHYCCAAQQGAPGSYARN